MNPIPQPGTDGGHCCISRPNLGPKAPPEANEKSHIVSLGICTAHALTSPDLRIGVPLSDRAGRWPPGLMARRPRPLVLAAQHRAEGKADRVLPGLVQRLLFADHERLDVAGAVCVPPHRRRSCPPRRTTPT